MLEYLGNIATIVVAGAGVYIAFTVRQWSRRQNTLDRILYANNSAEEINSMIISDPILQQFELDNHHIPGLRTREDVKKMYLYFKWLNRGVMFQFMEKEGCIDSEFFEARFDNLAQMTYPEREFVRLHCFPRGYPESFISLLEETWRKEGKRRQSTRPIAN